MSVHSDLVWNFDNPSTYIDDEFLQKNFVDKAEEAWKEEG